MREESAAPDAHVAGLDPAGEPPSVGSDEAELPTGPLRPTLRLEAIVPIWAAAPEAPPADPDATNPKLAVKTVPPPADYPPPAHAGPAYDGTAYAGPAFDGTAWPPAAPPPGPFGPPGFGPPGFGAAGPGLAPPRSAASSRRMPLLLAATAVVLVLLGSATVAAATYFSSTGPTAVVSSYFRALARGDAPRALSYGAAPSGDRHLLTSAVLRTQQRLAPLVNFTVLDSSRDGDRALVHVGYDLDAPSGSRPVQDTVTLQRQGRQWRVASTAVSVHLAVATLAARATVAGNRPPVAPVLLFPGAAPVEYDSALLQQAADSDIVSLTTKAPVAIYAGLVDSARTQLQQAVRTAASHCLTAKTQPAANCPQSVEGARLVPGTLRGSVTDLTLQSTPALQPNNSSGLVGVTGTLSVTGTWTTLDFDNLPVAKEGVATVAFTAHMYVTDPGDVTFGATT